MTSSSKSRAKSPAKYLVILGGGVLPEKSRAEVIDNLAALFHVQRDNIEPLLQGRRSPLAKQYARARAIDVRNAIREAGAQCEIEEVVAEPIADEVAPDARDEQADVQKDAQKDAREDVREDAQEDVREDAQKDARGDAHEDAQKDAREHAQKDARDERPDAFPHEAELMRFVAVNTDYYRRQFAKFAKSAKPAGDSSDSGDTARATFALTWHWPAFFAFFFWAVYRKLWLPALCNLAGGLLLALTLKPGWVYLAWAFFWPLSANYLYFRHACKRMRDAAAGGVSRIAPVAGALLVFFLSLALNHRIAPESGSGFGAHPVIRPEAKTAGILHATALLALLELPRGEAADREAVFAAFRHFLERKRPRDAWGNEIELRRDADGGIVLVSAGADGYFDNDDDIRRRADLGL